MGREEAERYRDFAKWSARAVGVLGQAEAGPPPSIRELAALADLTLGSEGPKLIQALFASSPRCAGRRLGDPRLRGLLEHWAAHSQQPPDDSGTAAGAIMLAAFHGAPSARPAGGSRGTVDALVRCLDGHGGELRLCSGADRIEVRAGSRRCRAGRWRAHRGAPCGHLRDRRPPRVQDLHRPVDVPAGDQARDRRDPRRARNVVRAQGRCGDRRLPKREFPAGFEQALMLSPNTTRTSRLRSPAWRSARSRSARR